MLARFGDETATPGVVEFLDYRSLIGVSE